MCLTEIKCFSYFKCDTQNLNINLKQQEKREKVSINNTVKLIHYLNFKL